MFAIQSANRLETSEPPKMIYDTIKTKPTVASNVRAASGGVLPAKMLKTMEEYQVNRYFFFIMPLKCLWVIIVTWFLSVTEKYWNSGIPNQGYTWQNIIRDYCCSDNRRSRHVFLFPSQKSIPAQESIKYISNLGKSRHM